ncbi:hypothetical protein C1637_09705 [Chryseobacterium lactis]|uniref:Uncharacterized protein n=1 Tax=Chryseobacterium lactis TaxID=1241981 RepID=A0A3G6RHV8_CHRLC|nr:hypothetical protein [Chryseobacterium lactis]AZA82216.1 hypothetical protein EG342_10000 [Chryseobacterium lactis]AZB02597.1 hypothetical protein EG341_00855 [Chryseobacterium lactis]PNW14109.1 hypothetical protein C1637_09705 [Chryseobacterium lactis]
MIESDKNMLKAIDMLKQSKVIKFKTEAYLVMNLNTVYVHKVKNPDLEKYRNYYHFTAEHIRLFCTQYKINANFIYGFETNMYRK